MSIYKRQHRASVVLHLLGYFILGFVIRDMELLRMLLIFALFMFIDVSSKEKYTSMLMVVTEDNGLLGDK